MRIPYYSKESHQQQNLKDLKIGQLTNLAFVTSEAAIVDMQAFYKSRKEAGFRKSAIAQSLMSPDAIAFFMMKYLSQSSSVRKPPLMLALITCLPTHRERQLRFFSRDIVPNSNITCNFALADRYEKSRSGEMSGGRQ